MYLETDNLIIRSIQPEDEAPLIEMASDGSLTEIFGDCSQCHEWMGEFISEAMQLDKENNPFREYLAFVVEDKMSHEVIGSVGSSFYEDFKEVGVTYFIGAKHRGHGYAAQALSALVEYLYADFEINKLVATASVYNIASCTTLEKAGFVLVETKMYQDMHDESPNLSHIFVHQKRERTQGVGTDIKKE